MFKAILSASVLVPMAISSGSILSAAIAAPAPPVGTSPVNTLPIRPALPNAVTSCPVDPSISSITLKKGPQRGDVQISYVIINAGASSWQSRVGQQTASLRVTNGSSGHVYTLNSPLPANAAAGATMLRLTTPMIRNAFDPQEFGGKVDLVLTYDPDIYIDANRCNDDSNKANNTRQIDATKIVEFMNSTAESRTF